MYRVIMPALEMAQDTGTLLRWLKSEGEQVQRGEPLMEIETDKVTLEIESGGSGVLTQVSAGPGDEVPVGQVIALLLAEGEEAAVAAPAAPGPAPAKLASPASPVAAKRAAASRERRPPLWRPVRWRGAWPPSTAWT